MPLMTPNNNPMPYASCFPLTRHILIKHRTYSARRSSLSDFGQEHTSGQYFQVVNELDILHHSP